VGALTALFAATIGCKQWDIKKVLAYSTVSQLGYMFVGVGAAAYAAGVFHLVTHAFFKALLFLGSGSVIHAMHRAYHATHRHDDPQDMRNMGGLAAYLPATARTMWIATLAIAGIPPLAGFFSKDEILAAAFARGAESEFWYVVWVTGAAAALLTAFYMARLMFYTFHGPNRTGDAERAHLREPGAAMTVPLLVLAGLTVVGGAINLPHFLPAALWLHHWLEPVTRTAVAYAGGETHLALATEIGLLISAVVVALAGLWLARTRLMPEALVPASRAPQETGLQRFLLDKWRVDELYEAVVIRPIVWLSRDVLWKIVDAGLIDAVAVNGSAVLARTTGWLGSRLQSGQVGTYVTLFVIGALALLGALVR
jgi:NADH-quinone oxidoreductase subunit L